MVTAGASLCTSVYIAYVKGAGVGMFIGVAVLLLVKVTLLVNIILTAREFMSLLYIENKILLTSMNIAHYTVKNNRLF